MSLINQIVQRQVACASAAIQQSTLRLSSGLRVNSSRDDPSGFAIANNCKMQILTRNVIINNINDYVSFSQISTQVLTDIKDVVLQKQTLLPCDANIALLDTEIQRLVNTKFNEQLLISPNPRIFQVSEDATDVITLLAVDVTAITSSDSVVALTEINSQLAIQQMFQQSLSTAVYLCVVKNNTQTAKYDQIMNVDTASETVALTQAKMRQLVGLKMLAMLNEIDSGVLSLLTPRNNYST
jgi:flagellin